MPRPLRLFAVKLFVTLLEDRNAPGSALAATGVGRSLFLPFDGWLNGLDRWRMQARSA